MKPSMKPSVTPKAPAGPGLFKGAGTPKNLADILTQYIKAPIVDMTGLTKRYDIALVIPLIGGPDVDSPIPDAVEAQLGLRLIRQAVHLDTVIIDQIQPGQMKPR